MDSGPDHGPAAPAPTPAPAPRPPAFTQILALARRELGAFFGRPAAWVFVAAFLVAGAVLGLRGYFTRNVADLRDYFAGLRYAFVLLAPAAAMRLWAEEKRARTLELLFSLPLSPTQAVLGKYLAGLAVVALALLLGAWLPLTLSPFSAFDPGQVLAGYLGAFLLAATFLALGMLGSALSSSQEVAFLVGALACLLLNLLGDPLLIERAALYLPRSWVLAGAGFAVGPHYESLARGLLETRSLAYFGGVTTFALFLNVLLVERRVHGKREAWLAAGLALVALVLWIDLGGQRALNRRLDLTRGGLNSLSPATRRLVSEVKGELLVRAYLSQTRLPEATQPAIRSVLDLLEALDAEGAERVRLEVIDPATPELQADAERQGVERFQLQVPDGEGGMTVKTVYAGVVCFYEGRPPAAVPVAIDPRVNLEYELALAIRKLLSSRPRAAVAGRGSGQYEDALEALAGLASVEELDLRREKEVPEGVDLLLYAAPIPPSEREVYVLDQYLQRGGRLILLAESHAAPSGQPWLRQPLRLGALGSALAAWGVRLGPGLVAQVSPRVWPIKTAQGTVQTRYPYFLLPSAQTSAESPIAAGLGQLLLPFAAEVTLEAEGSVLLTTEPAWALEGALNVHPAQPLRLDPAQRKPRSLAVARRAELVSPWAGKPGPVLLPEAGGGEDPLARPLASPRGEATLIVVGDTDFLRPAYLGQSNNRNLLLNLAEWALADGSLASIRARETAPLLGGREQTYLGLSRDRYAWVINLAWPLLLLALGLGRLSWLELQRGRRATALRRSLAEGGAA